MTSVSYTHLDVYKRQVCISSKYTGGHTGSRSPVERTLNCQSLYVDILDLLRDKKKFQQAVRDGIFWLNLFDLSH